ncbi:MAG: SprT family zinc-dependent metalloprotease [Desulfocapsaceae bacterium]|nr:SprT family zinc-dependent metalloprotease [Desulfocapsaceae bacterium]
MVELKYSIVRSCRRKTAAIIVHPDSTIEVRVPATMQESVVAELINTKRSWINDKQAKLKQCELRRADHRYQEGEEFLLRGDSLTLVIDEGRGRIDVGENNIRVTVPPGLIGDDRCEYVNKKIRSFYSDEALRFFRQRSFSLGRQYDLLPVYVGVKEYISRWGCCFSDGRIYFNWKLIQAPEQIIDYVIVHELCHLRMRNHGKTYWQMVAAILPDWQESRTWLHYNGQGLEL